MTYSLLLNNKNKKGLSLLTQANIRTLYMSIFINLDYLIV